MSKERDAELESHADQLAIAAAMELLDLGWQTDTIAKALSRPQQWIDDAIDKLAAQASAGAIVH